MSRFDKLCQPKFFNELDVKEKSGANNWIKNREEKGNDIMTLFMNDEKEIENLKEAAAVGEKYKTVSYLMADFFDDFRKRCRELESQIAHVANKEVKPLSLNDWTDAAFGNAKAKGWHDTNSDDFVAKLCLIHSEVSEVLEDYRNNRGINEVYFEGEKPCGIPIELADVLIRVFDLCGKFDIDIQKAVEIKHEYNKTRPMRHGGKKI